MAHKIRAYCTQHVLDGSQFTVGRACCSSDHLIIGRSVWLGLFLLLLWRRWWCKRSGRWRGPGSGVDLCRLDMAAALLKSVLMVYVMLPGPGLVGSPHRAEGQPWEVPLCCWSVRGSWVAPSVECSSLVQCHIFQWLSMAAFVFGHQSFATFCLGKSLCSSIILPFESISSTISAFAVELSDLMGPSECVVWLLNSGCSGWERGSSCWVFWEGCTAVCWSVLSGSDSVWEFICSFRPSSALSLSLSSSVRATISLSLSLSLYCLLAYKYLVWKDLFLYISKMLLVNEDHLSLPLTAVCSAAHHYLRECVTSKWVGSSSSPFLDMVLDEENEFWAVLGSYVFQNESQI